MSKTKFVYVTYIRTTPEKVWQAITEGPVTRQYWEHENVSDWKPGSPWEHRRTDAAHTVDLVGKVLETTPPRKLVISWAAPQDRDVPAGHSRVTFLIEPMEDMVRLTVTHDDLEPGSNMEQGITEGWPRVLSSMKSFLETGRPLATWFGKEKAAKQEA
ncbi:MAG TPA: SRPBCC family protein [bacterium]|jgi:uncharacterized protein YndB with AHSA1/START domain